MFAWLNEAELGILDAIQRIFGNPVADLCMPAISFLANAGWGWIVCALVLMCMKKHRKTGLYMLLGMLCGLLIGNLLLKNLIARERPCWIREEVRMLVSVPKDYSFPSGHTLASAISAAVLFLKEKRVRFLGIAVAVLIAFSRLYLYVHFPTDVLCGGILGVCIGICVCKGMDALCEKKNLKI